MSHEERILELRAELRSIRAATPETAATAEHEFTLLSQLVTVCKRAGTPDRAVSDAIDYLRQHPKMKDRVVAAFPQLFSDPDPRGTALRAEVDRRNQEVTWSVDNLMRVAPHLRSTHDRYTFQELLDYDQEQVLYRCYAAADHAGESAKDCIVMRHLTQMPQGVGDWLTRHAPEHGARVYARSEPYLRINDTVFVPYQSSAQTTLGRVLSRRDQLPLQQRVTLFDMIVRHVHALHAANSFHGDLRPISVLISQADREEVQFVKVELLPGLGISAKGTSYYSEEHQRWFERQVLDGYRADLVSCGKVAHLLFDTLDAESILGCLVAHIVDSCKADRSYTATDLVRDVDTLGALEFTAGKDTFQNSYRFHKYLASGSQGVIFAAESTATRSRVAVKLFKGTPPSKYLERFANKTLCGLASDVLVRVHDTATRNAVSYEEMELLDGQTLASAVQTRAPSLDLLAIGMDLALACLTLHFHGFSEIDLTPANAFLCRPNDRVKLLDYRATPRTEELHGTRAKLLTSGYVAPEVEQGRSAGPLSDVYSLGVILRELLDKQAQVLPHVQVEVRRLTEAMSETAETRRPDMVSVYFELRRLSELKPTPPPPIDTRVPRPWRTVAIALAIATVSLAVAGGVLQVRHGDALRAQTASTAAERTGKERALAELAGAQARTKTLEEEKAGLEVIMNKAKLPEEQRRQVCLTTQEYTLIESNGCASIDGNDSIKANVHRVRTAHIAKLEASLSGGGRHAAATALELMRIDPKNLAGVRTLLGQSPTVKSCRPYLSAIDRVLVDKTLLPADLEKRLQVWQVACAGDAERIKLLTAAFDASGDAAALISILLTSPDQGVVKMSKLEQPVQCSIMASAVTALAGKPASDSTMKQIQGHMTRLKCSGPARLKVEGGPPNAKVYICPKGDKEKKGCGSENLPYTSPPDKFQTFSEYEAYVWWMGPNGKISSEPISITLSSDQMSTYYVRSLRVEKQGRGQGNLSIEVDGFDKRECDRDPCVYLARSVSLSARVTATEAGTSQFAGWTSPGCSGKTCDVEMSVPEVVVRPRFTAPPVIVLDGDPAGFTIDGGVACSKECDVTVGEHVIVPKSARHRVVPASGECAVRDNGCAIAAARDGRYTFKLKEIEVEQPLLGGGIDVPSP